MFINYLFNFKLCLNNGYEEKLISKRKSAIGYNLGVNYNITENIITTFKYTYINNVKLEYEKDHFKFNIHKITLGLNYNF